MEASRPRIAIPVPTSFDEPYNLQSWPEYAAAVERSGGSPVRVELQGDLRELQYLALDGVLLPESGADVDPLRYGHERLEATAPADPAREAVDRELLARVDGEGLPLLAICFGLQSLNVHRGGTLVQDLPPLPVNHRAGRAVAEAHGARVEPDSRLFGLGLPNTGQGGSLLVNSSHHQAIGAVGVSLRVVARSSEDNVVEAVEDPAHRFLLGVQWHPERTLETSPLSEAIFRVFVQAAALVGAARLSR